MGIGSPDQVFYSPAFPCAQRSGEQVAQPCHFMLGEFEILALSAVLAAGEDPYGITIHGKLADLVGSRATTLQQLYTTLARLEEKGLLRSTMGSPTPVRGGRAKKFYRLTRAGLDALALALESMEKALQVWWGSNTRYPMNPRTASTRRPR